MAISDKKDNGIDILTQLGLTIRQAEVYLAIVELGQPTAKSIAQTLQIARAEVYRASTELQKLGLIKTVIATPTSFRATPLSDGLAILLQQNAETHEENCKKAKQFLLNFKNKEKPKQEDAKYHLTSGAKCELREYSKNMMHLQTNLDGVFVWKSILVVIARTIEDYKKALKRGVKMRYIANIPEDEKMPQIIQTLKESGSFELKSALKAPNTGVTIFDKKVVHIITVPRGNHSKIEVLRSTNPTLLELAQDYFELKWKSATTPCWHKKSSVKTQVAISRACSGG